MVLLDIIIIVLLVGGFISGTLQGLIVQIGLMAGFFVSIWIAKIYSGTFALYIDKMFEVPPSVLAPISFLLCFLVLFLFCYLIVKLMHTFTHLIALGWLDHLAGGFLGIIKTVLILSVIFFVLSISGMDQKIFPQKQITQSVFYIPVQRVVSVALLDRDPKAYWDDFQKQLESALITLKENIANER